MRLTYKSVGTLHEKQKKIAPSVISLYKLLSLLKIRISSYHVSQVVLIESSKALVKPEVVPPRTSDEISEPHVSDLMRHDVGHTLFVEMV